MLAPPGTIVPLMSSFRKRGMNAMRLLLDTNVLIDLYTQRPSEGDIAKKLLVMREFGDAELWTSAKSLTDIFRVLHETYSSERIQSAFEESFQWLEVCSVDFGDLRRAAERKWSDFEGCLVDCCAEKVKADYILTRNQGDFVHAHAKVASPQEFFDHLESYYGIVYEEAGLV